MDTVMQLGGDPAIETMLSRVTNGSLRDPAPSGADLERIVAAGLRAPDHGKLRPWRFVAIRGEAKARFAELCVAALRARDPEATEAEAIRMRGKLTDPPLILALGMHVTATPKVPETEQVQSVAAAAMNMLNAAHALGYAGKWVSGPNAYDPAVAAALGFQAPDRVIGYLYLGTPAEPAAPARRPDVSSHLSEWSQE
jgi:nitroreductase